MKRMVAAFLVCGIVCPWLWSQELPFFFHISGQPGRAESAPTEIALRGRSAPGLFYLCSNVSSLPRGLSARPSGDFPLGEDSLREALLSNSNTLAENDSEELIRIKKQRRLSGILLASSWAATVIVDLCVWDVYRSTTLIPVVGPWITLARMARNNDPGWEGAKALLVVSGVAQTVFATWFIISLTRNPKPKEAKAISLSVGFNTVNLGVSF